MLVIRLTRFGKKKQPFYRIVIADRRAPIQGKYIEKIGHYNPLSDDKARIFVDKKLAEKWLKQGAQPSNSVHNLLVEAGILKKKIVTKYHHKKKEKKEEQEKPAYVPEVKAEEKKSIEEKSDQSETPPENKKEARKESKNNNKEQPEKAEKEVK